MMLGAFFIYMGTAAIATPVHFLAFVIIKVRSKTLDDVSGKKDGGPGLEKHYYLTSVPCPPYSFTT